MNWQAAEKAKKATAYPTGLLYAKTGISLLAAHCWQSQYELTLALHSTATEMAYLHADLDEMDRYAGANPWFTMLDRKKCVRQHVIGM